MNLGEKKRRSFERERGTIGEFRHTQRRRERVPTMSPTSKSKKPLPLPNQNKNGEKPGKKRNKQNSEVGVDDHLVAEAVASEDELIEVLNGCICCTVRGDLIKVVTRLLDRKGAPLDAIVVETTGLADPAPVLQSFLIDDALSSRVRPDAVVTLVDAAHVARHLDDERRPESAENETAEEIAFADRVLVNKCDLVTAEERRAVVGRVRAINGHARIFETELLPSRRAGTDARGGGGLPEGLLDDLLGIRAFDVERILEQEPDFLTIEGVEHTHDESVTSVGIEAEGELDEEKINAWLSELLREKGNDLFRSKGILSIKGSDAKFVFQGVHMLLEFGVAGGGDQGGGEERTRSGGGAGGASGGWKPGERRINRLVFIGRDLDRDELNRSFRACLAG